MSILKSKTVRQTAILFGAQLAMVGIGFGIKTIQTRFLGPEGYGLYAFFGSITGLAVLFFRLGFFSSLQVVIAETNDPQKEREYFGLGFLINLVVGILFSIFIWISSIYIDKWYPIDMGWIFRAVAPLAIILPTRALIEALSVGSNKVQIVPIYDNVSKLLFVMALIIIGFYGELNVFNAIAFNLITLIVSFWVVYRQFSPSYKNIKSNFGTLWKKVKSYGFPFYIGNTANQSTFKLDEIFISYFINTTVNGFYTLATIIASPMVMGSQALSNALFKDFSTQERIPKKVFIYNTLWLIVSITFLFFTSKWIVILFFGEEFSQVPLYITGLSIAFFFQGLYQPFNFLMAKSKGKELRNVAILEAVINLTGNIALIPILGVTGAIYTSILAKFIHFLGKWYYYNRYINGKLN